ncbi:MarR family winged helix-turn-helix transcriptional regulator [Sporohalobacter salinus]|uniref:MarR family winged helix-turn-helix transcriptional regulator n=1 Tax=Sporohalobacter salinus TaxID=1494606 RepID=UPI0019618308|nr:MarR family transcriptional regulator [Sporohalobacter salinus]MBM7624634.1 DNA-binding MarR family transcriptional regulator [Sporohalobacter salinus]
MISEDKERDFEPIGKYLSVSYRALNSYLDQKLAEYDVGRGQLPFLIALYRKEGVSQQQLCEYYNFDKATVGRAIAKLRNNNLVKRKKDPEDKRQYKIFLTEKGKKLKPIFLDILKDSEDQMRKNLTEKEINQFLKVLKQIIHNLGVKELSCWTEKSKDN